MPICINTARTLNEPSKVKRIFLLFFLSVFCIVGINLYAEDIATSEMSRMTQDELNQAWREGLDSLVEKDYSSAIMQFERIAQQYESAAVYHNLSLAYAGGGYAGLSVLAKERALLLKPNLYSESFWSRLMLPPNYILFLGVVAFWHLLFFSVARLLSDNRKAIRNVFLCFAILWFSACFYGVWRERDSFSKAIVVSSEKQLKVSPTEHSPDVAPLVEGEAVVILKTQGEWHEVKTQGKQIGWISVKDCIPLWK